MPDTTNIAVVGVGGQGVLLASDAIAHVALCAGYGVKKNEIHGMAQRGGSVISEVRFGRKVWSPVVPDGEVDVLLALEALEALRSVHRLREGGLVITDEVRVRPAVRPSGAAPYPEDVLERLRANCEHVIVVPASQLAERAGNLRAANTVLLGVLSRHFDLPLAAWQEALKASSRPSLLEVNLRAARGGPGAGRPLILRLRSGQGGAPTRRCRLPSPAFARPARLRRGS